MNKQRDDGFVAGIALGALITGAVVLAVAAVAGITRAHSEEATPPPAIEETAPTAFQVGMLLTSETGTVVVLTYAGVPPFKTLEECNTFLTTSKALRDDIVRVGKATAKSSNSTVSIRARCIPVSQPPIKGGT